MNRASYLLSLLTLLTITFLSFSSTEILAAELKLEKGDKIVIIGNTFAERMQHAGDFEVRLQSRFPELELTVRNLGWSADELTLRPRSKDFQDHGHRLEDHKPDVVFACFGFNESFKGLEGLEKFKFELREFIKTTTTTKYNSTKAPQLVLISPITNEDLVERNVYAGKWNNKNIELYSQAMRDVAKENNVVFVDLFSTTQSLMQESDETARLTINGSHLKTESYRHIGKLIDESLFGLSKKELGQTDYAALKTAVVEKNLQHFYDYRAVNGYYIYGGRKKPFGVVNFPAEMSKLRKMVINRDQRIWKIAQGVEVPKVIDDSNTGEFAKVETNINFEIKITPPEEALKTFTLPEGYEISLFASEVDFPDLQNPVQMTFDAKGRLWVCTMPTYPMYLPGTPVNDKILIYEDTNNDGKADKQITFTEGLHLPTGFELGDGGCYVANQPDLLFLKDIDGDDKADVRTTVLHGFDSADSHHSEGAFEWGPGGALYFMEGTFHHTQIETPYGPERVKDGAVFRYEPKTEKVDIFVSYPFNNPWGHSFDKWGQNYISDASNGANYFAAGFSGDINYPNKRSGMKQFLVKQWRPTAGSEIVSSRNFPDETQGDFLLTNCIGFQGILQYRYKDDGAGRFAEPVEPLLRSSDLNFRPIDMQFAPDGTLYVVDWFNPLVGHMQHSVRDPNRDKNHGRVWRIRNTKKPLVEAPEIAGQSIPKLLDLLHSYEDRTRYRVRLELRLHDTEDVMTEIDKWIDGLDKTSEHHDRLLLEALWVHQHHDVVDEGLLYELLESKDERVRAAATRVFCYWRDRVTNPLDSLKELVTDPHPRVKLEAIRTLSFFKGADADFALRIAIPTMLLIGNDDYLKYTLSETMQTLSQRSSVSIPDNLLTIMKANKLTDEQIVIAANELCNLGDGGDMEYLFDQVIADDGFSDAVKVQVMNSLADAAASRKIQPGGDLSRLKKFIDPTKPIAAKELAAIKLTGLWKVESLAPDLKTMAELKTINYAKLKPILAALSQIGGDVGPSTMKSLATDAKQQVWVRVVATEALSDVDLKRSAEAAASLLKADKVSKSSIKSLVRAFLSHKSGTDKLAEEIQKISMNKEVAKLALQYLYSVGRSDPMLSSTLSKAAGITGEVKELSKAELAALSKEVLAKGDAHRGEAVFRRAELSCMKCHAVSKAGGNIGPDLSAVGGSSPVEYLIQSLMAPSQAIKEAYKTAIVVTDDGKSYTGIVTKREGLWVYLRQADGKEVRLAKGSILVEQEGDSLMPKGLTQFLTDQDMLDLTKYLSELGKPGEFAVRTKPTIQKYQVLKKVNRKALTAIPEQAVLRTWVISQNKPGHWTTMYAKVAGGLPLNEASRTVTGNKNLIFLKAEIEVTVAGEVSVKVPNSKGVYVWINDTPVKTNENDPRIHSVEKVQLDSGKHTVFIRVDKNQFSEKDFSAEVNKPSGSSVQYTVVGGQ